MAPKNPPRDGEGDRAVQRRGGGGSPSLRSPETYTARRLRREMSLPEVLLWRELRGASSGLRFRKQHPIPPYYADFYCAAARLVIEIDGSGHAESRSDAVRDAALASKGFTTLRIGNHDVIENLDGVLETILRALQAAPPTRPLRGHPPHEGEGRG